MQESEIILDRAKGYIAQGWTESEALKQARADFVEWEKKFKKIPFKDKG